MLLNYHTLYLEATRRCNFTCDNCSSGSNIKREDEFEFSTDQIINRILIPAWEIGTRYIEFSGGEFLLRDDAFLLLKKANEIGFRIGIASNGSTLNDKTIQKLKTLLDDNVLISLGINSFSDLENKKTRCTATNSVLKLIEKLEESHVRMNICVTIGKHTASEFAQTIERIRELKLPHNRIPYSPRNSGDRSLMFDKELMKSCFHPVLRKYFHGYVSYVPFFLTDEDYLKHTAQEQIANNVPTNPSVGCWCGSFYAITPNGEVAPCPLLGDNITGGNVLTTDLKSILFDSDVFRKIVDRSSFGGKCGKCKFKFSCGGCRSMAFYKTGDLYGEDPTCFIDELSSDELKEIEHETAKNFKNFVRMAKYGGFYSNPEL